MPTAVPPRASSESRRFDGFQPLEGEFHLAGIPGELLAQSHGHRILQMGAADLAHVCKLPGLFGQRLVQLGQGRGQALPERHQRGDVNGRGDRIVARLAQIDVIVGMHRRFSAPGAGENFVGP